MLKRLTYANVVATIALFAALSTGGAYAAGTLIKGKRIAKNAITSPKVKDGSLKAADLDSALVKKLAEPGAAGKPGAAGAPGAAGRDGAAVVAHKSFGPQEFPNIKWVTVGTMDWTQPANTLEQVSGIYVWSADKACTGGETLRYQIIVDGNEISSDYGNRGREDSELYGASFPPTTPEKGEASTPDPGPFGAELPLLTQASAQPHHLELRAFAGCAKTTVAMDDLTVYVTQYAMA